MDKLEDGEYLEIDARRVAVRCSEVDAVHLYFVCPFCKKDDGTNGTHMHGSGGDRSRGCQGSRCAHCGDNNKREFELWVTPRTRGSVDKADASH